MRPAESSTSQHPGPAALAIERDEHAVELARLEFKPDFNVEGGLMYRGSLPPMWQASVSVTLPARARVKGGLAEAQAHLAAEIEH